MGIHSWPCVSMLSAATRWGALVPGVILIFTISALVLLVVPVAKMDIAVGGIHQTASTFGFLGVKVGKADFRKGREGDFGNAGGVVGHDAEQVTVMLRGIRVGVIHEKRTGRADHGSQRTGCGDGIGSHSERITIEGGGRQM